MSMASYLPTAQANLKAALLAYFDGSSRTKDEALEQLANLILSHTKTLVENGAISVPISAPVSIPSISIPITGGASSTPNAQSGGSTLAGTVTGTAAGSATGTATQTATGSIS